MSSLLPAPDSSTRTTSQARDGASAPPQSLTDRVAALPAATLHAWLANAVRPPLHSRAQFRMVDMHTRSQLGVAVLPRA